ncbi:hypothetical protein C5167_010324 [Papaver somniferum]|uniref:Uncharacterized protein n=1 Tax=Papaver somniferum TaxID=3469 RepID=A0A4Y7K3W4_PAPSO|nr:hypothetical protein C5167_010324 [Papaver somniferum]
MSSSRLSKKIMFSNFRNGRKRSARNKAVVRVLFEAPPALFAAPDVADQEPVVGEHEEEEDEEVNFNSGEYDEIRDEIRHEDEAVAVSNLNHQSDKDEDEEEEREQ